MAAEDLWPITIQICGGIVPRRMFICRRPSGLWAVHGWQLIYGNIIGLRWIWIFKTKFDILKAAAVFFLDYLFEDEHGNLVSGPSTSPENTYIHPDGEQGNLCIGPSMDSEIIRDVIEDCLSAARLLNCEDDQTKALAGHTSPAVRSVCGKIRTDYGVVQRL